MVEACGSRSTRDGESVAELDGELWRTGQDPIGFPALRLRLLASKTLQSIQRGKTTRVEFAKQSRAWRSGLV